MMVPETRNTTVRWPALTASRREPGPLSWRFVTATTPPPRPPAASLVPSLPSFPTAIQAAASPCLPRNWTSAATSRNITDARLTEGELRFLTRHLARDIEVINLDGLSEAEALKAAGLAPQ